MHCQHFSGFFRFAIGTFRQHQTTLRENENPHEGAAMETIVRICLPLSRRWKWPKANIGGFVRSFGDAVELYRKAISMAYVTALVVTYDERNQRLPNDDLEGRDPRW
jgi:hypothetical protein